MGQAGNQSALCGASHATCRTIGVCHSGRAKGANPESITTVLSEQNAGDHTASQGIMDSRHPKSRGVLNHAARTPLNKRRDPVDSNLGQACPHGLEYVKIATA